MKPVITLLLASIALFVAHTQVNACDLDPTAVITLYPDDTVFFEGEQVFFNGYGSSANCGYISGYRWQVDGVTMNMSALYGPSFSLQNDQDSKTVDIQLRVQNSVGNYDYETVTITIVREHSSYYYLTDHLGSVRVTVDEQGNSVGWDDYYPFGLQMPGRTQNANNPDEDIKFTGYELEQQCETDPSGGCINDVTLGLYHAEARMYDPVIGRFMQVDPMTNIYPSSSSYIYSFNNPIVYVDPTGETVECTTREDCEKAANDINETHEGAEVEVTEVENEKRFLGFLWKTGETETTYRLSTGSEDYDWGKDDYSRAVYDALATEDITFTVIYTEGNIPESMNEINRRPIQEHGGGHIDDGGYFSMKEKATLYVDPRGSLKTGEPSSVILMHEMIGHGHPIGGNDANKVNAWYISKLGLKNINTAARQSDGHGGFRGLPWRKTNLFKK